MNLFARYGWLLACVVLALLGTGLLLTNLPFSDEGFYGVPAYFLATQGILKNPIMETAGVPTMTGIHTILYWMAPGAMVLQAAAFKVFGFHVFVQRALSLIAAIGTLLLWWQILRRVFDRNVAGLACLLLSVDYVFTSLATRGRADMLSLFFSSAGLAGYLILRERSMVRALLLANACCAVSGLIHPNGGIAGVLSLAVTVLYFDRERVSVKSVVAAIIPYLVFGAAWGLWIERAPAYFAAQFLGNAHNRVPHGVIDMVRGEVGRYVLAFGAQGGGAAAHARAIIPLAYLVAVIGCFVLRSHVPRLHWLLLLALVQALALLFIEGSKQGWYLVYSMPVLDALLAIWLLQLLSRRTVASLGVAAAHVLVILAVAAGLSGLVIRRHYQREYVPAVAFLNSHVSPGQSVFGRAELFFGMRCKTCLIDDEHLGMASGRAADWLVVDPDYAANFDQDKTSNPAAYAFIERRLGTEYEQRFEDGAFDVRLRTTPAVMTRLR